MAEKPVSEDDLDSFMEDVFGEDVGSNESNKEDAIPDVDLEDDALDDIFDDLQEATPTSAPASASAEPPKHEESKATWVSLDNDEKDDFLNWLGAEEPEVNQGDAEVAPKARTSTLDSEGLSYTLDGLSSLSNVLNSPIEEEETIGVDLAQLSEDEMTQLYNLPVYPVPAELSRKGSNLLGEVLEKLGSVDSDKVKERLEVLLEIENCDPSSIQSSLVVDGYSSDIPKSLRYKVWLKALEVKSSPAIKATKGFSEDYSSAKMYKSKLPVVLSAIGWEETAENITRLEHVLAELCRLKLQDKYNILVLNLLIVAVLTLDESNIEEEYDTALLHLLLVLCDAWGGAKGDWRSTGFTEDDSIGVGGMAWSQSTVPETQLRRHNLLRLLLFHHDPALAIHLDKYVTKWNVEAGTDRTSSLFHRLKGICESFYPSVPLFGLFAVLKEKSQQSELPPNIVRVFWDACLLQLPGFTSSQSASFYISITLLILHREELFKCRSSGDLRVAIDSLPKATLISDIHSKAVVHFAGLFAQATPECFHELLVEPELLLRLPGGADDDIVEAISKKEKPPTVPATSSSSWFSNTFKSAQDLIGKRQVKAEDVKGEDMQQFLIVLHDPNPGIILTRSPSSALTIKSFTAGSESDLHKDIHISDIVMSSNGILVVGAEPESAMSLMALQDRPLYLVVSRKREGDATTEVCQVPGLRYRLLKFYLAHNTAKIHSVDTILSLYHSHEAVLLRELADKYGSRVSGDPCWLPFSSYCLPISARFLLAHAAQCFIVDCRPEEYIADTGTFPTAYVLKHIDDSLLDEVFEPLRGSKKIVFLSSGSYLLPQDCFPSRARELCEEERVRIDGVASLLLRRGFPGVCTVDGGFVACFRELLSGGYNIHDHLVNGKPNSARLRRYYTFVRYKKSSSGLRAQLKVQGLQRRRGSSLFDATIVTEAPKTVGNMVASLSKYLSVDEEDSSIKTAWKGMSSTLKKLPTTEELSNKLKTALVIPPQDKPSVDSNNAQATDATLTEDKEVVSLVEALKKGDSVCAKDMGKYARFFIATKDKASPTLSSAFSVKRTIVIACFRFIVMETHPMRPGHAFVKSNRPLSDVVRVRFQNEEPSRITIFVKASNNPEELVGKEFTFNTPDTFLKVLQYTCALLNQKKQKNEQESS